MAASTKTASVNTTSPFDRVLFVDLTFILAIWFIGAMVINPVGEFPLIDDWAYSRDVHGLLDTGGYRTLGWGPESLVTHVLLGALFCLPTGFSFTALRLSCEIGRAHV